MENIEGFKKKKLPNEAIILAGGYGKRLGSLTKKIPKPMVEINQTPFIEGLVRFLITQKIDKIIIAVSYKNDVIRRYFKNRYKDKIIIEYSIENKPFGTGGAIKKGIIKSESSDIFVLNGDSFFNIDLEEFYNLHKKTQGWLSLALKYNNNNQRYGSVIIDNSNKIVKFTEKQNKASSFINAGIYIIQRDKFIKKIHLFPEKFSFEKDFLPQIIKSSDIYGFPFESYFIDIGIPYDLEIAKEELKNFSYWNNK